jgi:hypothetical protein
MAKCKQCGKSGLFLRVDKRGLCPDCADQRLKALRAFAANPYEGVLVLGKSTKLNEVSILSAVSDQHKNIVRILTDSAKIMENTKDPSTFYSRKEIARREFLALVRLEKIDPSLFSSSPAESYSNFEAVAGDSESKMWARAFEGTVSKIGSLKTDRAKANAASKYLEMLDQYDSKMSPQAVKVVSAHREMLRAYLS